MSLKFQVLLGSVRSDRDDIKVARSITRQIERHRHEAVLVNPPEINLPLLDRMYKSCAAWSRRQYSAGRFGGIRAVVACAAVDSGDPGDRQLALRVWDGKRSLDRQRSSALPSKFEAVAPRGLVP